MKYLIRLTVAIITFGLSSGLAGLLAPSTTSRVASRYHHCEHNLQAQPLEIGVEYEGDSLDAKWVFVEKDLHWYPGFFRPAIDGSGRMVEFELAPAQIVIFSPSGMFAEVTCDLSRNANDPSQVYLDKHDLRVDVFNGAWARTGTTRISVEADLSHRLQGMSDGSVRIHLKDIWEMESGQPQDQTTIFRNGQAFVHIENFVSLRLLSSIVSKPVDYQRRMSR